MVVVVRLPKDVARQLEAEQAVVAAAQHRKAEARLRVAVDAAGRLQPSLQRNSPMAFI